MFVTIPVVGKSHPLHQTAVHIFYVNEMFYLHEQTNYNSNFDSFFIFYVHMGNSFLGH